jgi:hypothetical protein
MIMMRRTKPTSFKHRTRFSNFYRLRPLLGTIRCGKPNGAAPGELNSRFADLRMRYQLRRSTRARSRGSASYLQVVTRLSQTGRSRAG